MNANDDYGGDDERGDGNPAVARFGTLDTDGGSHRLTFVRRLRQPPAVVWAALTEPEQLEAWFPTRIDGRREAGAALRFVFRNGEGATTDGSLLVWDPPRVLALQWGGETLRFELRPLDGGTELTFTDTFTELGKAARDGAGWHVCLDLLERAVDGEGTATAAPWPQVHPHYVAAFGPQAATIGPPQQA
jgi:uncharacterized protein YndB with AHSA1/START domain